MEKSIIIGAGGTTQDLIKYMESLGYNFRDYFCLCADNNCSLWGSEINGVTIDRVETLKNCTAEEIVISSIYEKEIRAQLKALDIHGHILSILDFKRKLMVDYQVSRYYAEHSITEKRKPEDIKKLTVYTVIIGRYDSLNEVTVQDENVRYICFTDDKSQRSNTWEIRYVDREFDDPILESRKYKMLPHLFLDTEYSLYMDANIQFRKSPLEYMRRYFDRENMLFIPHMDRDCIYREMAACIIGEKDLPQRLINQTYVYSEKGCPEHAGLFWGGLIGRRQQEAEVILFNEEWWEHFQKYSRRDQLSLGYLLCQKNYNVSLADIDYCNNDWFFCDGKHKCE